MADDNARELAKRGDKLFAAKANLNALWQELALNFYPERADFTVERALGEEFAIDLFDSEPLRCRRDLGNARASMLRPAGQEWFEAKSSDPRLNEKEEIGAFFDAMNERARSTIYHADTGFVRAEKEADQDVVTFGGSVKTAESDINRDGRRMMMIHDWHLRDCAWKDDVNGIRQDLMFRKFKASARHIKQKFPDATLHDSITKALEKDSDKEFNLCHVMMLADEYEYYKKPSGPKTQWVSIYYDAEHKTLLRERPSKRFRYVVDKWGTISGSQYPFSPAAMTALPDARGIQVMARVLLEAGEKAIDPPMKIVQKAMKSDLNLGAAGLNFVDRDYDEKTGPVIEPILPGDLNPGIGIDLINRVTFALRDTWFLTKLTLPQQAKTAYETAQLVEEFIRANIPLFEPWEAGTEMMLSEIFAVMIDDGVFGPYDGWPKELLGGQSLEFTFNNPLQNAIERNKTNQAQIALGILGGAVQVDPNAVHAVDMVKIVQAAIRGSGAPADWLPDEDTANANVAKSQQAGNIVQGLNAAGQAADVANTGIEAAQKLRELTTQPAADQSAVYGPT